MNCWDPCWHPSRTPSQMQDLRLAASKMTGAARRAFQAEMTLKYCHGSARLAETILGWSRKAVEVGLAEHRTGLICVGAQSACSGRKRWEEHHPEAAEALRQLAEAHAQQDLTFRTALAYTRLTAKAALEALRAHGVSEDHLPSPSTRAAVLHRLGYRLRKVLKAKPQQKLKETDAIFAHIKKDHTDEDAGQGKCVSMDCKATVNIGAFSRGGYTRGDHQANDHDLGCKDKYIPCGIVDEDTAQLYVTFGSSAKTSDCIVDTLAAWRQRLSATEQSALDRIPIKMDNGSESSGVRTQFLHRVVQFVDTIGKSIQLLSYPPYHSKYNPIERCWGIMALHGNGAQLLDVETMLEWAKRMTWKGVHPIVELSHTVYAKGVSLSKAAMRAVEARLERNSLLPKWDILIHPAGAD